jgi:hypothetical protein
MKNFPIQTFLFWKTDDAIKARKFMIDIEEDPDLSDYYDPKMSEQGQVKTLVLDGQQRLQSLFSAFDGSFQGRDVYIDITGGVNEIEEGRTYDIQLSDTLLSVPWFRTKSLLLDRRNSEDIADDVNGQLTKTLVESEAVKIQRERRVRRNVGQLVSLLREDKFVWIEELDGIASNTWPYETVLNIFIRVNSGGTKLDPADLVFAAMKEAWSEIEQNVETVVDSLNKSGRLGFDKSFVLKAILLASGKGVTLSPEKFLGAVGDANLKDLENKWPVASQAFDELRDFIYNELNVYSDKVIRSYNAFVPIYEYLFLNPKPSPEERKRLQSYYYGSQLFNWFSARTDQLLEAIHGILATNPTKAFPLNDVRKYFAGQGKDGSLTNVHLSAPRLRFILLNMLYVNQLGHSPFDVAFKGNEPHIDHIFPKSKLRGYSAADVNHIGNYRFVGASDNLRKRAEDPSSYFARLKSANVDIARHLLVQKFSDDPSLLTITNYPTFRQERTKLVFDICAQVVNVP